MEVSRKSILIYFSVLLIVGIAVRILISPILWPEVPEVGDPLRIIFLLAVVILGLGLVYYVREYAGPKGIKLFYTISIGLSLGFGIYVTVALLYKVFLGYPLPDFLFIPTFAIAYITAFYIGDKVAKKKAISSMERKYRRLEIEKETTGKPKWRRRFLPLIIVSCAVLIVLQVSLYLLAYIELFRLFGGVLLLFLAILLSYGIWYVQTRYQHSKTVHLTNKIAFILSGAFLAPVITLFTTAFIILATGLPPPTRYLGTWTTLILLFAVPSIIGAFITYWIGKRRDYRPFM